MKGDFLLQGQRAGKPRTRWEPGKGKILEVHLIELVENSGDDVVIEHPNLGGGRPYP